MPRRTIQADELRRLAFCNSKKLPQVVEWEGRRRQWVGIGWVDEGKPTGREVLVVDGAEEKHKGLAGNEGEVRKLPVRPKRRQAAGRSRS